MAYEASLILLWILLLCNGTTVVVSSTKRFKDVVTGSPCSQQTCQLQSGDVVMCCFLKPLNDLNQIIDLNGVPRTFRLHIMFIDHIESLCTQLDDFQPIAKITSKKNLEILKHCSSGFKLNVVKNSIMHRVSGLTIGQTGLQYISETVFNLFPEIKHLVIEENIKLLEIPSINQHQKKQLQTINFAGNRNVHTVNWNEHTVFPALREFAFSNFKNAAGEPTLNFNMGVFTPGKNFTKFVIRLNYQNALVKLPNINREQTIQIVYIGSSNIPEKLKVDFNKTEGKISKLVYNFLVKPDHIFPNLLPSIDLYTKLENIELHFDNENFELRSQQLYHRTPASRSINVQTQDDQMDLLAIVHRFGRPKQIKDPSKKHKIVLQYTILTSDELVQIVKNTGDQYVIKTYFFWIRNISYLQNSIKIRLLYNFLIISRRSALFSTYLKSPVKVSNGLSKEYQSEFTMTDLWDSSFEVKQLYEYICTAVNIARTNVLETDRLYHSQQGMRYHLVSAMFKLLDEEKLLTVAESVVPAIASTQYHYLEDALHRVSALREYVQNQRKRAKYVVDFSSNVYQRKTVLLQETTKMLITSEKYERNRKSLGSGNQVLFDMSKARIELLKTMVADEIEKIVVDEKSFRGILNRIKTLRTTYESNFETLKKRFFDILQGEKMMGKFKSLISVLDSILKVFSEKFKIGATIFSSKDKRDLPSSFATIDQSQMISVLGNSLTIINSVINKIQSLQSFIQKKFVENIPRHYENLTKKDRQKEYGYFTMRKKQLIYKEGFRFQDAMLVTKELNDINIQDILRWDTAMKQLDRLLDTSISSEVPETLVFKTTLLRIMDIGKVQTQAMYDIAKTQARIFMGNYTMDVYNLQLSQISQLLITNPSIVDEDIWKGSGKLDVQHEFKTTRALDILQLKLDIFLHLQDYCSWMEYRTLEKCTLQQQFDFDASLSTLLILINELLIAPVVPTGQRPNEQTFVDLAIRYKYDSKCEEIIKVVDDAYKDDIQANRKKKSKKDHKKTSSTKFHMGSSTPIASTKSLVNPDLSSINPWSYPYGSNFPMMLNPFNSTVIPEDRGSSVFKKTRVESNLPVPYDVSLHQKDDDGDFMTLMNDNTMSLSDKPREISKYILGHMNQRSSSMKIANKTSLNKQKIDDTMFSRSLNKQFFTSSNATNKTLPSNSSTSNSFSNITTTNQSPPLRSTSFAEQIADSAESEYTENDIKGEMLADWIGERIIENEIRKHHKAIEDNAIKRNQNLYNGHNVQQDVDGEKQQNITTYLNNGSLVTNSTRKHKRTNSTVQNTTSVGNKSSTRKGVFPHSKSSSSAHTTQNSSYLNAHNVNVVLHDFNHMTTDRFANNVKNYTKRRQRHSGKYVRYQVVHNSRVRRSDDATLNIFNDNIAMYMVTNGIETRERFETMFRKCNASKVVELQQHNFASVSISLLNKQFKPFDHVRVDEMKVVLRGAKTATGFLEIVIESESIMQDRLGNKKFIFTGDRWSRVYRYKIPENSTNEPIFNYEVKGDIHRSESLMLPTPFTTWYITVSNERNPGLDLSSVTSIDFILSGSALINSRAYSDSKMLGFFENIKSQRTVKNRDARKKNKRKTQK